jgi:hypothetical protein
MRLPVLILSGYTRQDIRASNSIGLRVRRKIRRKRANNIFSFARPRSDLYFVCGGFSHDFS